MLHPKQFYVNQAWIVFQVNEVPVRTASEGDFNFVVLMDAASCFILSNAMVSTQDEEPSTEAAQRLFRDAEAHKNQLPRTLLIPDEQFTNILPTEAERQGIDVVRVPEDQLLPFIGEAREAFKEHFN